MCVDSGAEFASPRRSLPGRRHQYGRAGETMRAWGSTSSACRSRERSMEPPMRVGSETTATAARTTAAGARRHEIDHPAGRGHSTPRAHPRGDRRRARRSRPRDSDAIPARRENGATPIDRPPSHVVAMGSARFEKSRAVICERRAWAPPGRDLRHLSKPRRRRASRRPPRGWLNRASEASPAGSGAGDADGK